MHDIKGKHRAVVDAFAHLIADVTKAPCDADAKRLRSVTASALRLEAEVQERVVALCEQDQHG